MRRAANADNANARRLRAPKFPHSMSHLIVHGGTPLSGRIVPSANKNAVLPILCATLLTKAPVRLRGVP